LPELSHPLELLTGGQTSVQAHTPHSEADRLRKHVADLMQICVIAQKREDTLQSELQTAQLTKLDKANTDLRDYADN